MRMPANQKSIHPVAKAADFRGFTIAGLWKRFVRKTGHYYSYASFHGTTSGRIRIEKIEAWLIEEGFGEELKEAQVMQKNNKGGI